MDGTLPLDGKRPPLHVLEILGNGIVGGMEAYVARLCAYLKSSSFDVSVLCPFEGPATAVLRREGCRVLIAPVTDDPTWSTLQRAATFVSAERVDIMHSHLGNAHVLGVLTSALTGVPCVATIHGRSIPMLDLEAHRLVEGAYMSVVCQSAYGHACALGVAPERLRLIPNGVSPVVSHACVDELHKLLRLPPTRSIVGFVGRLAPEKGPELFVQMASHVAAEHPDVSFVVIGDGPLRRALEKQAAQLSLQDRVHFLGVREDVLALLPSLSILVMSSHSEGLPLALMEAMAAGVPVVATSVGGIPELVAHSLTGLVVPPNDAARIAAAVGEILSDPSRREAMRRAARERASMWPLEAASRAMADYLRDIVRRTSRRKPQAIPHKASA